MIVQKKAARMTKKRLEFLKRCGRCEMVPLREASRYWRNVAGLVELYWIAPETALAMRVINAADCARMRREGEVIVPTPPPGMIRLCLTEEGLDTVCAHDSEWAQILQAGIQ